MCVKSKQSLSRKDQSHILFLMVGRIILVHLSLPANWKPFRCNYFDLSSHETVGTNIYLFYKQNEFATVVYFSIPLFFFLPEVQHKFCAFVQHS